MKFSEDRFEARKKWGLYCNNPDTENVGNDQATEMESIVLA